VKTISIKIPEVVHQEMKELGINWSEEIRKAIENRIRKDKMKKACKTQDDLRKKASGRWSGSEEIRKWRDLRK
jgi:rRNA-processing protein FCF1